MRPVCYPLGIARQTAATSIRFTMNAGDGLLCMTDGFLEAYNRQLRTIGFDRFYVRGQGACLWDAAGNRYLDFLGGYAVFNVGRNHPVVRQALRRPSIPKPFGVWWSMRSRPRPVHAS